MAEQKKEKKKISNNQVVNNQNLTIYVNYILKYFQDSGLSPLDIKMIADTLQISAQKLFESRIQTTNQLKAENKTILYI